MFVQVGDSVPAVNFRTLVDEKVETIPSQDFFKGKKVHHISDDYSLIN